MARIEDLNRPDGGRGFFNPDCFRGGPHKYGQGHFIPDKSLRVIQYCRRCGESKITEVKIKKGQINKS